MKNLLTLIIFSTVALLLAFRFPQTKKLNWMEWNEAFEKAKKQNKPLLIDAYTDWCGWCKTMDKNTYSQTEIINYIEKNYIPVKFNPEIKNVTYNVNGNELSGPELLGALTEGQQAGYPTTFFLSIQKNSVKKVPGYKSPEQFLPILKEMSKWHSAKD